MRDCKFKQVLLLSSALGAGLSGTAGLMAPAQAGCTSYTPSAGTVVTCSGTSSTSVVGSTDVTINFQDGAQHTATSAGARIGDGGEINLYGSAAVTSSGVGLNIIATGNGNSVITLNGSSSVTSTGSSAAIVISGHNSKIILNDQSSVINTGTGDGIQLTGSTVAGSNTVIVGDNASITVIGSSANAVDFINGSSTLVNYGMLTSAGVTIDGTTSASLVDTIYNYGVVVSSSGAAIALYGGNDRLTLGTGSSITGSIDGGDGTDDLTLVGSGSEDSNISNFESLIMNGINWTLVHDSKCQPRLSAPMGRRLPRKNWIRLFCN